MGRIKKLGYDTVHTDSFRQKVSADPPRPNHRPTGGNDRFAVHHRRNAQVSKDASILLMHTECERIRASSRG